MELPYPRFPSVCWFARLWRSDSMTGDLSIPALLTFLAFSVLEAISRRDVAKMVGLVSDLAERLGDMESRYDEQFKVVLEAIRDLMEPPAEGERPVIGLHTVAPSKS